MNRQEWAEKMLDQMDIIVANGDFEAMKELAEKYNKDFWIYGAVTKGRKRKARYLMGLLPWIKKTEGSFFWMYNYWSYDPDNCAVYKHPDNPRELVHSTWWQALREGRDDLRYIYTAKKMLEKAYGKDAAENRIEKLLNDMIRYGSQSTPPDKITEDREELIRFYNEPQKVREELINMMLELNNQ